MMTELFNVLGSNSEAHNFFNQIAQKANGIVKPLFYEQAAYE
jgi:hypothetical protein